VYGFILRRRSDGLNLGRVLTLAPIVGDIRESPQRRLMDAKKRRVNVSTNSQQSQPSLRDWIIITPSTGVNGI
jgi:hypothetical protein